LGDKKMIDVDVICLTNTTSDDLYWMTRRTLTTIHDSEKDYKFHVHLIETNSDSKYNYSDIVENYVKPNEKFNYNRFLNHSYPYVKHDWVLITNNDVRYERGWFSKIIEVYTKRPDVESFSPKCPILYSKYFYDDFLGGDLDFHESVGTSVHLMGWSLVMKKRVFDIVYPWDENFYMYYQDNDYAEILLKNNIKHGLVRDSIATHLESQTIKHKFNSNTIDNLKVKNYFYQKWGKEI
jgi:hypothetical protein